MTDKIVKVNQSIDRAVPVSVIRKELTIGEKTVSAFMDAKGSYYLNFSQIEELLETPRYSFFSFLGKSGHLKDAQKYGSQELRTLWSKGLITAQGVSHVQSDTNAKYRAAELDLVAKFILDQAYKGNLLAQSLNNVLLVESLQIRCESVFVGVSPNVEDIQEQTNLNWIEWLTSREMNKNVHSALVEYCKAKKYPGNHVHDRMTLRVFGQTAKQAIAQNTLIGFDPSIGLDYQENSYEHRVLSFVKNRFCSYRKGTWQEKVDRAYQEALEKVK